MWQAARSFSFNEFNEFIYLIINLINCNRYGPQWYVSAWQAGPSSSSHLTSARLFSFALAKRRDLGDTILQELRMLSHVIITCRKCQKISQGFRILSWLGQNSQSHHSNFLGHSLSWIGNQFTYLKKFGLVVSIFLWRFSEIPFSNILVTRVSDIYSPNVSSFIKPNL